MNSSRAVVNLNGDWQRYVHGKPVGTVAVPSSLRPGGFYSLQREFLLPKLGRQQRAFLHFDGVNYYGRVSLNGKQIGTTIPSVPQEFECTEHALEGRNLVQVEIVDAGSGPNQLGKEEVAFGTTGGWESYGGIIRDVYAEVRPATYIENVRLGYDIALGSRRAKCTAEVFVASTESGERECELALLWGGLAVARAKAPLLLNGGAQNTVELTFDLDHVALWSPTEPNLYQLQTTIKAPTGEDSWSCRTGFREIKVEGRDFFLNGERLVLDGVCRHDMWEGQGFTLTRQQQEKDMRMIKAMGCNFIRLVHYPHDRRIIDHGEALGLLLSEEPGYWGMDFEKFERSFVHLGLRVLETTIRRDWNSPAVMAWLLGNECNFTESYLKEAKALCNKVDPIGRLVSVAHINGDIPHAKKMFDSTGLDFYDWHAYEFSEDKFIKYPQQFGPAKPLTFTEWGWEEGGHGDWFYERDFDDLLEQCKSGKVAGHSFWSWNDMRQYTREDWATADGILASGAVTEDRNIREPIYSRLAALFAGRREIAPYNPPDAPRMVPLRSVPFSPGSKHEVVDLQPLADSRAGKDSWASFEENLKNYWPTTKMAEDQWPRTDGRFKLWQTPVIEISGVEFRAPVVDGYVRPLVLTTATSEITIAIDRPCSKIHFLGQVTFPRGYPLQGRAGEIVATYSIAGSSGTQDFPIRNGVEVAQANRIYDATRVDPIATDAQPALEYVKDIVREQYQFLLWSVPIKSGKVRSVRCKLNPSQPALAILAITIEA